MKAHSRKIIIALLMAFSLASAAYAHGVTITYNLKANGEVELYAEFDTGEPMAEGQVTIYAPTDPTTPWLTDTANAEGRYTFVIDPAMPGTWDIQFRQAGHGDMVHLQLEEGAVNPALMNQAPGPLLPQAPATSSQVISGGGSTAGGFTPLQIILMSASVIWGFIGTALYFASRKSRDSVN